ncbi:hypothetical protein RJT34_18564 [Clitoria ternatea]|uniref:Ubiquitin-like protease family profile domain-containing protein n=1 Tax=Clitoria ternatea TaxID=43366 RepID=A0AAN9PEE2_CLITE
MSLQTNCALIVLLFVFSNRKVNHQNNVLKMFKLAQGLHCRNNSGPTLDFDWKMMVHLRSRALFNKSTTKVVVAAAESLHKLIEEKKSICQKIQESPLLLPDSPGETEADESSGKTSQHPQKRENVHEKLDASYQIHGLEDFMQRNNPRAFYWGNALRFIKMEWGIRDTFVADMVLRELFKNQLIVSLIAKWDDVIESEKCMINPWIRDEWVKPLMLAKNGQLYERYSQIIAPSGHKIGLGHNCLALDQKKVKLSDGLGFKSDHWGVIVNVGASYLNFGSKWMAKMKNLKVLHLGRWEDSSSLHIEVKIS